MARTRSRIKPDGSFTAEGLLARFQDDLKYARARHPAGASDFDKLASIRLAIRDLAVERMLATQRTYADGDVKRVYHQCSRARIRPSGVHTLVLSGTRKVAPVCRNPFS